MQDITNQGALASTCDHINQPDSEQCIHFPRYDDYVFVKKKRCNIRLKQNIKKRFES